eukprot:jgi/Tetstr1/445981/TSEL_003538.t1
MQQVLCKELDLQGAALHELRMLFLKRRRGKTSQLMGVKIMSKARQLRLQEAEARRREAERKTARQHLWSYVTSVATRGTRPVSEQ